MISRPQFAWLRKTSVGIPWRSPGSMDGKVSTSQGLKPSTLCDQFGTTITGRGKRHSEPLEVSGHDRGTLWVACRDSALHSGLYSPRQVEKLIADGLKCQGTTSVVPQNAKRNPALAAEEMQVTEKEYPQGLKPAFILRHERHD